jgi:hypothetical protein
MWKVEKVKLFLFIDGGRLRALVNVIWLLNDGVRSKTQVL